MSFETIFAIYYVPTHKCLRHAETQEIPLHPFGMTLLGRRVHVPHSTRNQEPETNLMGHITSLFVRKVIGITEDGIDREAMLRSLDIEPDSPVDPSLMVSASAYYDFLERLARAEQEGTTLGLRAGGAMLCDDYGAMGLAMKTASRLRGTYERAERYARVLTSVSAYEVVDTDGGAFVHLHREGERRLGMRLSNEATISALITIGREVSGKALNPLAVYFKHPAPKTTSPHDAFFGCPVHFGTDRDALLFSEASLALPNLLGDEAISKFFDTHLDAELSRFKDNSLDLQVRKQVRRSLSEGVPTISDVAGHLGMSGRTLQRRLADLGHSFQSLLETTRRQLAEELLQQTEYSLAEIAFMTGYSEQSAFARAFKRWAGQTPRSFRLQSQITSK